MNKNSGNPNQRLFIVPIFVRPRVEHPLFFEWGYGMLAVWLLDASLQSASERARKIVAELPYEVLNTVGDGARDATDDQRPHMQAAKKAALDMGFGIVLFTVAIGVEDPDFFAALEENYKDSNQGEEWKGGEIRDA